LATVSDTLWKRPLFSRNPGFVSIKMLVFLSALTAVIAGGGYLFYYVSKNPMLESTPMPVPKPASAPKLAPAPVPKPVKPSSETNADKEKVEPVPVASLPAPKRPDPKGEDAQPKKARRAPEAGDVNRRIIDQQFREHM